MASEDPIEQSGEPVSDPVALPGTAEIMKRYLAV